jgi:hypothetical protein
MKASSVGGGTRNEQKPASTVSGLLLQRPFNHPTNFCMQGIRVYRLQERGGHRIDQKMLGFPGKDRGLCAAVKKPRPPFPFGVA